MSNKQNYLTTNMFSGTTVSYGRNMFAGFKTVPYTQTVKTSVYTPITLGLNANDLNVLKTIYDQCSLPLAEKMYEKLPSDPYVYQRLLEGLGAFQLPDITVNEPGAVSDGSIQLLVQIAQDTLRGVQQTSVLYGRSMYTQLKVVNLTNQETDILSEKNRIASLLGDEGSQLVATKTIFFSPLYSNYIYFYGMPEFGVGFDPVKLDFIQRLLDLLEAEKQNPSTELETEILNDYTVLQQDAQQQTPPM